jgi:hypothetical protein
LGARFNHEWAQIEMPSVAAKKVSTKTTDYTNRSLPITEMLIRKKEIRKRRHRLGAPARLYLLSRNPFSRLKLAQLPALLGAIHRAFTFYLGNPFPRFLLSLLNV